MRRHHAAVWDEPLIMEQGAPGRRGTVPPGPIDGSGVADLLPMGVARRTPPELPEVAEPDVLRHYLRLSQETMGMTGTRPNERVVAEIAEIHPHQDDAGIQGLLEVVHRVDLTLRELSGMDSFVFQDSDTTAAYLHASVTRAYFQARGELDRRRDVITTAHSHPRNAAAAAAAGFTVVTLPVEHDGYPSVDALTAVVGDRTAALMVDNPDDTGIYNPHIKEWIDIVHEAGGLCCYDHADANGVLGRVRVAELGFDACTFLPHETVGAYGCSGMLAEYLPGPLVERTPDGYVRRENPGGVGRVQEFLGSLPQVVQAYSWLVAMGADGLRAAADISVLTTHYLKARLLAIPGVTTASDHGRTRFSLGEYTEETGVTAVDVRNRMTDFGIDACWLSREPWTVPPGWSVADVDHWIDVLAHVLDEGRRDPSLVRTAPHDQVVARIRGDGPDDPATWATTWRAHRRKNR
jgi:glycine dehydrogenase subunit 2